jgi:hypothetical protein
VRALAAPALVALSSAAFALAGAATSSASLAACAAPARLSLRPAPRSFTAEDYRDVYRAWTRSAEGFDFANLRDTLHVAATYQSWEFRWAYVVRYARDHNLDTAERTEMLRASLADAETTHRFFVTLYGRQWRESDLANERSAWRVQLVDEQGRATPPSEIEPVPRPGPLERTYFPTVSPFRRAFRLAFPARRDDGTATVPLDARSVTLRFTGPEGTVDLVWRFEDR